MGLSKRSVSIVFTALFGLVSWPATAQDSAVLNRMLESVVFVECDVEFQGTQILGGSGSGFLIGNSEYVITNNHVIDKCHSDNKIKVLNDALLKSYEAELRKGNVPSWMRDELVRNPDIINQFRDNPELVGRFIRAWIEKVSGLQAKAGAPNITQKLYVAFMGKEAQAPIKVDVANIAWSSWMSDEKASQTGVDVAILKLARSLPGRPSVAFATAKSAQINDVVYTVGFPGASGETVASAKFIPTLKKGIVSKLGGESPWVAEAAKAKGWKGVSVIETDAAMSPGNSGGPLYNEYGEVLGVVTFGPKSQAAGIGWAQDIGVVVPVLKDLSITLPSIVDKPRTWMDKNSNLLFGAAAALLLAIAAFKFLSGQRQKTYPLGAKEFSRRNESAERPKPVTSRAALKGRAGKFVGVSIPIPENGLVLGRDVASESGLVFPDNSDISRRHCTVAWNQNAQRFEVTDFGSTNGTFIIPGERRLPANEKRVCKPGEIIRLGRHNEFELVLT